MESAGKLKTVNELDPQNNYINSDNLAKFLSDYDHTFMDRSRPKGPDYLIIDNLVDAFENLNKNDLMNARVEVQALAMYFCDMDEDSAHARCDYLTWFKNLISHGDELSALTEITN